MTATHSLTSPLAHPTALQKVVVVSKQSQLHGLLETMLDEGQYDVVFVESTERAYTHIRQLIPDLVIVCLDVDDIAGFQVLSMLKLDPDTRTIPVVTCTIGPHADPAEENLVEQYEGDVFEDSPAICMN